MKGLDKTTAYAKLFEIQHKPEGREASKYINLLAKSESIPSEVIIYINRHERLPQLETYNRIYDRRFNNPLYRTITNANSSFDDMAIALSSVLTQSLIRMKELSEEDKIEYADIMDIRTITNALTEYTTMGDKNILKETFMDVRETFLKLFVNQTK